MKKSKLPNKPSELCRVALNDLAKCRKDPRYVIDMMHWHLPVDENYCAVCLAGSVMAQTFNAPINQEFRPNQFGVDRYKLLALNEFREGMIAFGLRELQIELPEDMPIVVHSLSGDTTEMIVEKVIAELEKFNL